MSNQIKLPKDLVLSRLLEVAPFCQHALAENGELLLGWRLPPPASPVVFQGARLAHVSAEAMVGLGVLHHVVAPAASERDGTSLETAQTLSQWERAINGSFRERGAWETISNGVHALLLRRIWLADRTSVVSEVEKTLADLSTAPIAISRLLAPLRKLLRRLLTEALLNVHEHAYGKRRPGWAWLAATVQPAELARALHSADPAIDGKEMGWLETFEGTNLLEVAIGDGGLGIPATLNRRATEKMPALAKEMSGLSAGGADFQELRARLQAGLCEYAFHHDSTCKEDSEFLNVFHLLNWRGLYRCYRQVVELGGGAVVSSGRGRAGYTSHGSGTVAFHRPIPARGDFPGTLLAFRLPLPPARVRGVRTPIRSDGQAEPLQLASQVIEWDQAWAGVKQPGSPAIGVADTHGQVLALALPLVEVVPTTEEVGTDGGEPAQSRISGVHLRVVLARALRQHTVPLICGAAFAGEWRREFRLTVNAAAWPPADDGPPRLVGWMQPDGKTQWVFAGAVPLETEAALRDLEETGEWRADADDEDPVWARLREELCAHHPYHVVWDKRARTLRLLSFGARLALSDFQNVLAAAWAQYWRRSDVQSEVIFERDNACVLLATGTRIRRHFSVFRLLHQSRPLTSALGHLLARYIVENAGENPLVVIDQPASRYICHALLAEGDIEPDVHALEDLPPISRPARKVVVFADAILRGRTVERTVMILRRRGWNVALIGACVDLRNPGRGEPLAGGVPVVSLVDAAGFNAEEINDPTGMVEWVTDSITHVPLEGPPSIFSDLAATDDARAFLRKHAGRFNVGFQMRSRRTHTLTLPLSGLMEEVEFQALAQAWVVTQIRQHAIAACGRLSGHDVVIFSRFDARLAQLAPQLADSLRAEIGSSKSVYAVRLPAAYGYSHTVYPQIGTELFAGCTELATGHLAFPSNRRPSAGYIGVYLDDAAVTGNSIRDFVHRSVAGDAPRPGGILVCAAVNRLSPGEVRFLRLCGALGSADDPVSPVPFCYAYLFNVQVRFLRTGGPVRHTLLDQALTSQRVHHDELRHYLSELRERALQIPERNALRHLFCTTSTESIPVSLGAVRLRHLLALNQQNEPVVLEILHALKEMTDPETRDPSVLTVLALEPTLLHDPPLRQFGRQMLVDLAVHALGTDVPLPQRSDALTVLASYPRAFHEHYREIAPGALADDALSRQLAVHLLAHGDPLEPIWTPPNLPSLARPAALRQARLHRILGAAQRIEATEHRVHSEADARKVIARLGSHFLHHAGPALANWDQIAQRLRNLARYWADLSNPERRRRDLTDCPKAIAFAEDVLLPGFPALALYAQRQDRSDLAAMLKSAHALAEERIAELRDVLPRDSGRATEAQVRHVTSALDSLHQKTWFAPTADRLLIGEPLPDDAGPLAAAFPRLFSAPAALLVKTGEHVFEGKTPLEALREPRVGEHHLTICPVPVEPLQHIFHLLLGNIVECGDPASLQVRAELSGLEERGGLTWRVELRNVITAPHTPDGQRLGIVTAREVGDIYGIAIHSDEDESAPRREWLTIITIPGAFQLDQLIQHPHA